MSDVLGEVARPRAGPGAVRRLGDLGQSAPARALREGMLWLVPYLMVWSAVILLAEAGRLLGAPPGLLGWSGELAQRLREALPLAIWAAVAATLALQHHLPRLAVAFVGVVAGLGLQSLLLWRLGEGARTVFILAAMLLPLVLVPMLGWLARRLRLLARPTAAGHGVDDTLNLVLPALLVVALLWLATAALCALLRAWSWNLDWGGLLGLAPAGRAALYALLNSALWSLGIHGYYALLPLLESIPALPLAGEPAAGQVMLGLYVFLGGSGATLSLIVALLLGGRMRAHRVIAWVSLAPALVNVNELLLFGLPLILNRRLLLPFVLVPLLNLGCALLALDQGWVARPEAAMPFNSPVLLNALLASGGDRAAVALQLCNVLLGALVYLPFVQRWERGLLRRADWPAPRALETAFVQRMEEVERVLDDPVGRFHAEHRGRAALEAHLHRLGGFEFVLHYQPQVDPRSGRVVGAEALLRLDDGRGQVLTPAAFLPDLHRAGLSRALDLWVLRSVVRQLAEWRAEGLVLRPVAVNLSAQSLQHRPAVQRLARLAADWPGLLVFEITEDALLDESGDVLWGLRALHAAGARLEIDDFGTGYSSLNYLHRMPVDGIKIDRSFTLALAHPRGRDVFAALCALARRLRLQVVVEGVETAEQLAQMPTDGPLTVQGWYFDRAMPAAQLAARLRG